MKTTLKQLQFFPINEFAVTRALVNLVSMKNNYFSQIISQALGGICCSSSYYRSMKFILIFYLNYISFLISWLVKQLPTESSKPILFNFLINEIRRYKNNKGGLY